MNKRRVIAYQTICYVNRTDFDRAVNNELGRGWELYGGLSVVGHKNNVFKYQQMVKYEVVEEATTLTAVGRKLTI